MKSNRIITRQFAKDMATAAKGCAVVISSIGLMALLFLLTAVSSAEAQTLQFTFPTVRATIPATFSNVITIPINNTANTNGLSVTTNGLASLDINGFWHIDPVNLNVSGLPAGATYNITDPNGVELTQIGNGNNGYATNNYHTNLLVNLFCTNVAQGVYTFYLNAGGTNGLPTNSIPLILQAAHIWNGNGGIEASFGVSNNWATATSWLGGAPGAADDVVFGDVGGQTNDSFSFAITNVGISANATVGSIRFASTVYTNLDSTNILTHTIQISPNTTLSITGSNGFSLLRDYMNVFGQINDRPDQPLRANIIGTNATLFVSNTAANFIFLHGASSTAANGANSLNMSNLDRFVSYVSRMGLAEYQVFPNYEGLNKGYNGNLVVSNQYTPRPGSLAANVYLARTNTIMAAYKDPNNYTNENRTYALSFESSEQQGLGGSPPVTLLLGATNKFFLDSVAFVRANHQGFVRFGVLNGGAIFRSTNFATGTGGSPANTASTNRLSVFSVSDDGGTTNMANSNVKGTVDFAINNGFVDILADRLYIARDRTLISSNQTPNVQGDLLIGRGNVDVNTAVLGFQEHSNKMDWTAFNPTMAAYLNYCQGRLIVTNGGTFKVNGTLTLGYTADENPSSSAQQYNTFGRVTIYAGSTNIANTIVCDGGRNMYDANLRQNQIIVNQGMLIVSNTIGAIAGLPAFDARGLPLDTLTLNSGTLQLSVSTGRTNVIVRTLNCPGTVPSVIKVASLTGVTVYPTNLPIISYGSATPFLAADMSAVGGGVQGYILNDVANKLVTLYLTTNAPKTLTWVGGDPAGPSTWNLTTTNWLPVGGGSPTNFALGDIVTFSDATIYTNIDIVDVVVPNQTVTNIGVTITNMTRQYAFNPAGGAVAGTAQLLKTGTNSLTFNAAETGPITIAGGTVDGNGVLGSTTVRSNCVLNFSGIINGSMLSTGMVSMAYGSAINGGVTIGGGVFVNDGTVTITPSTAAFTVSGNSLVTNTVNGVINIGGNAAQNVDVGCTLANFGLINTYGYGAAGGRLFVSGLYFGTGSVYDPIGGLSTAPNAGRFTQNSSPATVPVTASALVSPGATPNNSIGTMNCSVRLDLTGSNPENSAGKLLIEIDQAGSVYDQITCDRWNNLGNIWVMTNLNGSFSSGQIYHILVNNNGVGYPNYVDVATGWPLILPPVPAPGLQWNLSRIQTWGDVMVTNSSMIWDGGSSTSWDTNGVNLSWKTSKAFTNNMGAILDERASTFTVNLASLVAPAGYNTDTNPAGPAGTFFTNTPAFMPGIIVSNDANAYVIQSPVIGQGSIAGITSLYKTGPGTLTILSSNTFTGGLIIERGTLAFTNVLALGAFPAQRQAYVQMILDNNATLKCFGTTNQDLNRGITINQGGATIEVSNATTVLTQGKALVGDGALTKTGAGVLLLSSGGNYYAGTTTISEGAIRLVGVGLGSNSISIANGAMLQLTNQNAFTFTNAINIAGSAATVVQLGTTPRVVSGGAWTGSGTVTFSNASQNIFVFNGVLSNYSGTISFGNSAGRFLLNNTTNSNPCKGSPLATFDLGTSSATLSNLNGGGLTYDLGGLAGGASTVLAGRFTNNITTNAATTYSIGANGNDTTFSGKIVNGGDDVVTVVKVGGGKLLLNGANTYTGGTTVSNGTLGGSGSIAGALTVVSGATLSPGASVGTFTVGGNAILNGAVFMELNRTNTPATNDQLSVAGTITATGTLEVTNTGPGLYNNSKFQLFNKAVTGLTVTLPAKDPTGTTNYGWSTNIAVDGSITLISGGLSTGPNTSPFSMTNSYSSVDGKLTLSWAEDHTGYRLLSNSVSLTDTSMWFQVIGAEATNKVILTVSPAQPKVFFRLIYPYP